MMNDIVLTGTMQENVGDGTRYFQSHFSNPFEGDGAEHDFRIRVFHFTRNKVNPLNRLKRGQAAIIRGHLECDRNGDYFILIEGIELHAS